MIQAIFSALVMISKSIILNPPWLMSLNMVQKALWSHSTSETSINWNFPSLKNRQFLFLFQTSLQPLLLLSYSLSEVLILHFSYVFVRLSPHRHWKQKPVFDNLLYHISIFNSIFMLTRDLGLNQLIGNWWPVQHVCTIQHGGFRVCEGSKSVCSSSGTIFRRRWLRKAFRRC